MKRYFNDDLVLGRLINEYIQHKNLIIGFDFDNTVFDCHLIGLDCTDVVKVLKDCSDLGFTMCLWTISSTDTSGNSMSLTLEQKVKICRMQGIKVHYINSSPIQLGGSENKKQFFNILLDDRAGLESSLKCLRATVEYIKKHLL